MKKTEAKPAEPGRGSADYRTGSSAPQDGERSLERALGAKIRAIRRERDLSVSDLSSASKISAGMLSKIENGQISPSLSTLQSIAGALNVPLSLLFAASEQRRDCSFVRAKQGVTIERRGSKAGHRYQLLGHVIGGDVVVEPYLISLQEGATTYTAFQHAGMEFIYMLTGEVIYRHGDNSYRLRPGDSMLFDSGALHGPETLVKLPMTYLSIIVYPRS
ncbi:helix-turn-helix domain-containing protein [Rhodopseudomonas palustris]|jgi:transcriptional regulator with XRE-family HTH domain|uniref:helix-turn-helix domain-containing protein n=1 Tax=Rhodopseudomonas TaxID=1073 RepID=UPI0006B94B5D|nr:MULTISPECIES: helix-turn-helix domain-containing protein [Rhodopseudomonas]KPG01468.1 XRE family transcriptional regulator [Rhodopseudomonas sp. AAP120]MCP9627452.1 helix-turn-helix domain-containing protein [Rhodopseudomonas palustris]